MENQGSKKKLIIFAMLLFLAIGAGVYAIFFSSNGEKEVAADTKKTTEKVVIPEEESKPVVEDIESDLQEEDSDLSDPKKSQSVSSILNHYNQSYKVDPQKPTTPTPTPNPTPGTPGPEKPPVVDPPTKPTDPPTEPTDPPTKPTDPPTKPTDPPTEPTDPPTKPTDPPTEPTDPPTKPTDPPTKPEPKHHIKLTTWIPYWSETAANNILKQNVKNIDEINLFEYALSKDGKIVFNDFANGNKAAMDIARKNGIKVIGTIANVEDWGNYDEGAKVLHNLINTAEKRETLATTMATWAKKENMDGVDLNIEVIDGEDRNNFSEFVEVLAKKLHADKKILSVTVYPKLTDDGGWDGPRSQDWKRLGKAADQIKIMTYNYSMVKPGSQTPLNWLDQVVTFAKTQIPAEKIIVGLPGYGYVWSEKNRISGLPYKSAMNLIEKYNAQVQRNKDGEPYFTYTKDGQKYTAYYQDKISWEKKYDLLLKKHPDVGGIVNWVLTQEDPSSWAHLKQMQK